MIRKQKVQYREQITELIYGDTRIFYIYIYIYIYIYKIIIIISIQL